MCCPFSPASPVFIRLYFGITGAETSVVEAAAVSEGLLSPYSFSAVTYKTYSDLSARSDIVYEVAVIFPILV